MPRIPNIKDNLWHHFSVGGGVAAEFRDISCHNLSEYLEHLGCFFDSTTDYERYLHAHRLTIEILRQHNIPYLEPIRDTVRKLETQLLLEYGRQRDHTIHTLYMFLLGIWLYDHCPKLSSAINNKARGSFKFQWIYLSLVHDIGYRFSDLSAKTRKTREQLDELFTERGISSHFPDLSSEMVDILSQLVKEKLSVWVASDQLPKYSTAKTANTILIELDKAPWLNELYEINCSSLHDFFMNSYRDLSINPTLLREFAQKVAVDGMVEHGYASGFLLSQLTSFRHWIFNSAPADIQGAIVSGKEERQLVYYNEEALLAALEASYFTAAHNLPQYLSDLGNPPKIKLEEYPLLFLEILCDELQCWGRPPASKTYLEELQNYQQFWEKEIYIEENDRGGTNFRFEVSDETKIQEIYKLKQTLYNYLADTFEIVAVTTRGKTKELYNKYEKEIRIKEINASGKSDQEKKMDILLVEILYSSPRHSPFPDRRHS